MHRLAKLCVKEGRRDEAGQLLAHALELAPGLTAARRDYASILDYQMKWKELNRQLDILLSEVPNDLRCRALKASTLVMLGEYAQAIADYEGLLAEHPQDALLWIRYGHALRAMGRQMECVAAYRRSAALRPASGIAWRNLANLKTFRFTPPELEAMRAQLARDDLVIEDRSRLHFALGKALEDEDDFAQSFEHYRMGSTLRRARTPHDADSTTSHVRRCKALFTPDFFSARTGHGTPSRDPIFIIGMPRSGSTLIEQVLSSHSAIEGTTELPDMIHIAARLDGEAGNYPERVGELASAESNILAEEYLQGTRIQRRLGRPYFIDKMPDNFLHVGLIHLIFPHAKIIDARRHPLGCGLSLFRQDFARGMEFTYDLADIGRYYRDYVELMAHFDAVLPGRVHRVFYEDMVHDPETEIRRLLEHCGVQFEEACLRFHQSGRGVHTSSSEQVRQPIYADAVEQWKHFEAWLGPLKAALGPVLDAYPAIPDFQCAIR